MNQLPSRSDGPRDDQDLSGFFDYLGDECIDGVWITTYPPAGGIPEQHAEGADPMRADLRAGRDCAIGSAEEETR